MHISTLLQVLDNLAPFALAEAWDNCGLLVGDSSASVEHVLVTLELTQEVLGEAVQKSADTILTHHPVVFAPVRRIGPGKGPESLLWESARAGVNVVSCHTNLDAAPGGLAEVVGEALGLQEMFPLQRASAGWYKFVGFVPPEALSEVSGAVFAAGAGVIGDYSGCAYAGEGQGWFTPGQSATPAVGERGKAERVSEVRWETVVPRGCLEQVIHAYVAAHPYEEPAFDIYPVEDRLLRAGLGRVGLLAAPVLVHSLALKVAEEFALPVPLLGGDISRAVTKVAVLPGAGRSLLELAAGAADVLLTGDLTYHDSHWARDRGLALVYLPHGDLEWAAMQRWTASLRERLAGEGVRVSLSEEWHSPWITATGGEESCPASISSPAGTGVVRLWIDGGSRGNPGPSAIGVVLETEAGQQVAAVGRFIGEGTNNAAEYQALLVGLELAAQYGAKEVEVISDSELLVKQMNGEYRVKNKGLIDLFLRAQRLVSGFERVRVRHVRREENAEADALVNRALDESAANVEDTSALR